MKRTLRELVAEAQGTDSLGEILVLGKYQDSLDLRLPDGQRAMKNVRREVADALQDEIGGEHMYQGAIELGGRLPEGMAWDEAMTVDALRAKAELRTLKGDAEFRERALEPSAQERLRKLIDRANPELDEAR